MLFQRLAAYVVLLFLCAQFSIAMAAEEKAANDKYFIAVLDAALSAKKNRKTPPHIIDRVDELVEKSKAVNVSLVDLLDYSIGAGAGELLDGYISKRGKVMLPLLQEKKKKPLECLPKYQAICADKETRDENIDELIDAIEKGKVFETD
jgi:hypothetical protein